MADLPGVFWAHVTMLIVILVVVALRIYARAFVAGKMSADDWILVLATFMLAVTLALTIRGLLAGVFKMENDTSPVAFALALKNTYACEVLYPPISLAIRVSVCLFLLKLVNSRLHRHIIYVLLALVSAASIVYLFVTVFQCLPPSQFWNRVLEPQKGSCINMRAMVIAGYIHGSVSALSACVVGVLPVFILWNIRMDVRTKAALIVLLGMGVFACVALAVRMATVALEQMSSPQKFQTVMTTALWSMIEPSVGVFAASLPTLRPLFFMKLGRRVFRGSKDPNSGPERPDQSPRGREPRPQWEMTRCAWDVEAGEAQSMATKAVSERGRNDIFWSTCVERGEFPLVPPPSGIHVCTFIEVTVSSRDSSSGNGYRYTQGVDV